MNPVPELTSSLKQLRLSGILDTLEARNREAIDRKLAYTDFLTLLIQDEIARRDHRKLDARMRRANFRAGPCGTGKSHLAQALGHAAARQGHDVLFMTQTRLLGALRNAQAVGSYERRFQALAKVPLLIIDDFGLKPMRTPEDEDFHDLIAERYERTSTVLTSNLDFTEWGDAFATNKMLGAATLDRLRHAAYRVVLDGESYRVPRPMPESNKSALAKGGKNKDS